MQRRKFIELVGWGAVTWPLVVHAQQPTKMRRIGLLRAAQQPEHELAAFLRALSQHGYVQGRNFVLVPLRPSCWPFSQRMPVIAMANMPIRHFTNGLNNWPAKRADVVSDADSRALSDLDWESHDGHYR